MRTNDGRVGSKIEQAADAGNDGGKGRWPREVDGGSYGPAFGFMTNLNRADCTVEGDGPPVAVGLNPFDTGNGAALEKAEQAVPVERRPVG